MKKEELYEFLIKNLPGNWKAENTGFSLSISNMDTSMVKAIHFRVFNEILETAIFYKSRSRYWQYDVSLDEVKKFYKAHFKYLNFK